MANCDCRRVVNKADIDEAVVPASGFAIEWLGPSCAHCVVHFSLRGEGVRAIDPGVVVLPAVLRRWQDGALLLEKLGCNQGAEVFGRVIPVDGLVAAFRQLLNCPQGSARAATDRAGDEEK